MVQSDTSRHYTQKKISDQTRSIMQTLIISLAVDQYTHIHNKEYQFIFLFALVLVIVLFSKIEIWLSARQQDQPDLGLMWEYLSTVAVIIVVYATYMLGKIISDSITPVIPTQNWNDVFLLKPFRLVAVVLVVVVLIQHVVNPSYEHIKKVVGLRKKPLLPT